MILGPLLLEPQQSEQTGRGDRGKEWIWKHSRSRRPELAAQEREIKGARVVELA